MTPKLPAIVAASGLSTRMGTSKALMEVEGVSFLARVIASLKEGGVGSVLVVVRDPEGPEGQEAEACGAMPVRNPGPEAGPISSLQAGLRALSDGSPAVLFCPVDHPLFRHQTVEALIRAFVKTAPPFVAPAYQGRRGHPVLFGKELFPELLSPDLPEGARSVVARYLEQRAVVEVEDPGILADINTPDDFRRNHPEGRP
jgi:molybdenum cofactor cytidylyltransferase